MDAVRLATARASARVGESRVQHRPPPNAVIVGYWTLGVLLATYVAMTLVTHPHGQWWNFVNNWPLDGCEVLASALCLSRAAVDRSGRSVALLLGLGLLSWSLGDIVWSLEGAPAGSLSGGRLLPCLLPARLRRPHAADANRGETPSAERLAGLPCGRSRGGCGRCSARLRNDPERRERSSRTVCRQSRLSDRRSHPSRSRDRGPGDNPQLAQSALGVARPRVHRDRGGRHHLPGPVLSRHLQPGHRSRRHVAGSDLLRVACGVATRRPARHRAGRRLGAISSCLWPPGSVVSASCSGARCGTWTGSPSSSPPWRCWSRG